jgi:phospholipid/cholesterol/gamma-HCH transport system permease protein
MAEARQIEVSQIDATTASVRLGGTWRLEDGLPSNTELDRDVQSASVAKRLIFDTTSLASWDSSLVTFLMDLIQACRKRGVDVDCMTLPDAVRRLVALVDAEPEMAAHTAPQPSLLSRVGEAAERKWASMVGDLAFLGDATFSVGRLYTGRARHRRSDLYREIRDAGAYALPIVTLIGVLLGMILAFVGGVTLRKFGATIYVADLVAVAMVRELGAIMTAIIMAGRTGSAYAAELGSMRVSQEIDALVTMGLPPIDFVVLNRLLALSLMMPLLCVYSDFAGILGGGIVTTRVLGLTFSQYTQEITDSIDLTTFAIGVGKSAVFGVLVAMCGCIAGLNAGRNAAAVGQAATSAVVNSIVWIIVTDGLFAIAFYVLGI